MKGPLSPVRRQNQRNRRPTTFYTPPDQSVPQLAHSIKYETPKRTEGPYCVRLPKDWKWKTPEEWKQKGLVWTYNRNTPPEERRERNDTCQFMFHQFGNGWENETNYKHSDFYAYFTKYGRGDLTVCETFEKMCFICKKPFERGQTTEEETCERFQCEHSHQFNNPVFCASFDCPKVYHEACLHNYPNTGEAYSSELYVCPRHFCRFCGNSVNTVKCTYCPTAICEECKGQVRFLPRIDQRYVCDECTKQISSEFGVNAPELLMSLRDGFW